MTAIDVDVQRVREDFEAIWLLNVKEVELIKESETEAGNYGYDGEDSTRTSNTIQINIQGVTSGSYDRIRQGMDTSGSVFHCYVKYDQAILPTDRIKIGESVFIIKNLNQSFKDGQVGFIEFDLVSENWTE